MSVIEKQKTDLNQKKLKFALSVAVPLIIFAVTVAAFGMHYRTNDDATLANLAAGGYGNLVRILHINVIFSLMMKPFYTLAQFNWYVILQMALVLVSISVIFYIFMDKLGVKKGLLLCLAILLPFAPYLFYTFQYTKTGAVIISAGLILIADSLGQKDKKTLFGIILCALGSMLRWENFFAIGGLSAFLLLSEFFPLDKKGKKRAIITMISFFAVIGIIRTVDVLAYKATPEWDFFVKYNKARTEYSDYKVYYLNENNPFENLGIDDAEYAVLNDWDFYDGENFTIDLLEKLSAQVQGKSIKTAIVETSHRTVNLFHGESYRYVFLLTVLRAVLCFRFKIDYLYLIGLFATFGCEFLFLIWRGRYTDWVEVGILWAVVIFAVYMIIKLKPSLFNKNILVLCLLALCVMSVPSLKQTYNNSIDHFTRKHLYDQSLNAMSRDKENLYIISVKSLDAMAGYDILHPRTNNFYSNIVACGGWLSQSPHRNAALAKYGVKRPIVDGVDNPHVYFTDSNIGNMTRYAESQLGKKVVAVRTGENPFAPYQLITE